MRRLAIWALVLVALVQAAREVPAAARLDDTSLGDAQPAPAASNNPDSTVTKQEQAQAAVTAAEEAGKATAKQTKALEDNARMLLKPPGCRPTTNAELYGYRKMRSKCASIRPAPSAFSQPPTQTPIEITISDVRVTDICDKSSTFVMEFQRKFMWRDQAAQTNDASKLWTPLTMFSFPNSAKVEKTAPNELDNDGSQLILTEHLRVRFLNAWDYSAFPWDSRTLVAQIWSGAGTNILEPVTVKMDPVQLPTDLHGFQPTSFMEATVTQWGEALGPQGVWGTSQMVQLEAQISREPSYNIIKILVPITLCMMVAYASFFLKIGNQLMSRLTMSMISFLVLSTYMRVISSSTPVRSYLMWIEYWLMIQAVIIALGCCHHSGCHYLNEKFGETKAMHLDIAMRLTFPIACAMSYFWAQSIVSWKAFGFIFLIATVAVVVLFFVAVFAAFEKRTSARYEKSHYPGI